LIIANADFRDGKDALFLLAGQQEYDPASLPARMTGRTGVTHLYCMALRSEVLHQRQYDSV
jgi:hypothetical protein